MSIYGGGIRGILPCKIVNEIEYRISSSEDTKIYISDIFDLTAGTSIGGLLSLAWNIKDKNGLPKYDA